MNYTNGTRCNNQLHRSTTVLLHCSAPRSLPPHTPLPPVDILAEYSPSYIAAAHEPARCVYEMHWFTPLVCSAYRRVEDELKRRRPSSDRERREQLEREMEDEEDRGEQEKQPTSVTDTASVVVRGHLECIAAMSVTDASLDSYHSLCAAYLPSTQQTQQLSGSSLDAKIT